ncbi:MAG TPA: hypothetical protein VN436_04135 [Holophaga sp.]|nr:hypothetical protein [Holophaga sp.]
MSSLVVISHPGAPCTPAVISVLEQLVTFQPHPLDPSIHVAECSQQQADHLTCIPAFQVYGGTLTELPQASSSGGDAYDLSKPVIQWKNDALLARVKECWAVEAVMAKAAELGVATPEAADRSALVALVNASKPTE